MDLIEEAEESKDVKILVSGDVKGKFKQLFTKVEKINKKKGPFECLFCVGEFFSAEAYELRDLQHNNIKVPIQMYVVGPNNPDLKTCYEALEKVPNITYLGKKGCIDLACGLRVAYLGGLELPDSIRAKHTDTYNPYRTDNTDVCSDDNTDYIANMPQYDGIYFTKKDIKDIMKINKSSFKEIDILITSQWPQGITKDAPVADSDYESIFKNSSSLVSKLAKELKPRYHFSGLTGVHYEREPYRNDSNSETPIITRFYGLAPVDNDNKQKWLYAFKIKPKVFFTWKEKNDPATESSTLSPYFRETSTGTRDSSKRSCNEWDGQYRKRRSIYSSNCWFCVSNSNIEKQLIISIGTFSYVTLAKGILVPEHALIVPIPHVASAARLSLDVSEEIEKYKKSFANYFHDKNKDVVFFERNCESPHLQIQVVPVPKHMKNEIQDALLTEARANDLKITEMPKCSQIHQLVSRKDSYFYLELMVNKEIEAKYVHVIKEEEEKTFPLQFGRAVLASSKVLNVVDRVEWKKCVESKEKETEMVENMKRAFKPYDMTERLDVS